MAIDFTTPDAAAENARACARAGCPVVVGTTGWYDELDAVAADVERAGGAILTAPNFSVGVAVFDRIVAEAARLFGRLGRFADARLVETHHAAKVDAPSGTAGALARTASAALGRDVPITSVRVGHVPGTHELIFDSPFEQVRLVHEARDRRVFAEGALLAARLAGRPQGAIHAAGRSVRHGQRDIMSTPAPTGCGTALATPFTASGEIDEPSLRRFVDWQIDEGIDFLVPCGSTGEAATMSLAEHRRVVEIVVEQARGRVPVVAGAGSNDTRKAIALSQELKDAGATHLLHVAPMYSRPPQRGMALHFRSIADAVDLPLILYNVPSRTGCNIDASTTIDLAAHPGIVGTKEASGLLPQITDIIVGRPSGFAVLSGDDEMTLAICALGGDGLISVASNAAPRLMSELVHAALGGDAGSRPCAASARACRSCAPRASSPIPCRSKPHCPCSVASPTSSARRSSRWIPGTMPSFARRCSTRARCERRRRSSAGCAVRRARPRPGRHAGRCRAPHRGRGRRRDTPRGARARRDPRCRARRRRHLERRALGEARHPPRLPPRPTGGHVGGIGRRGDAAVLRQAHLSRAVVHRRSRGASRAGRIVGAPRRVPRAGCGLHAADVRERRRLDRIGHDGRLARARRLVRADRRARAPERRGADRRRARADQRRRRS